MILDTTAYSALQRGHSGITELLLGVQAITVPLPVIGELRHGFIKGSRQKDNEHKLVRFLAQSNVSVALVTMSTTEWFAKLSAYAEEAGRALSHNDLWIAAIAQETDSSLITLDKDFAVFEPLMGDRLHLLIDEKYGR